MTESKLALLFAGNSRREAEANSALLSKITSGVGIPAASHLFWSCTHSYSKGWGLRNSPSASRRTVGAGRARWPLNGERVWKVADPKNGQDFIIPLFGPIAEVIDRRLALVGGKGPLFRNTLGVDYLQLLKNAYRQLHESAKLRPKRSIIVRWHRDLQRCGV